MNNFMFGFGVGLTIMTIVILAIIWKCDFKSIFNEIIGRKLGW